MKHHLIHLMPREDRNLCFVDDEPEDIGTKSYKLGKGIPLGSDYPPNARAFSNQPHPIDVLNYLHESALPTRMTQWPPKAEPP